jgi:hypothetical protein
MAGTLMVALLLRREIRGRRHGRRGCDACMGDGATEKTPWPRGKRPDRFSQHRTCPTCRTGGARAPRQPNPRFHPLSPGEGRQVILEARSRTQGKRKVSRQAVHRYGLAGTCNPSRNKNSRRDRCPCKATRHFRIAAPEHDNFPIVSPRAPSEPSAGTG